MKLTLTDGRYILRSTYEERHAAKAADLRWDPAARTWWTDSPEKAARFAQHADETCREALIGIAARQDEALAASRALSADISIPCPEGLDYLPFQRAGIAFALPRAGVLFGDDMGLGKTIQAVGIYNADPTLSSVLILCPASLRLNWQREWTRWSTRPASIEIATTAGVPTTDIVICNYDIAERLAPALRARAWDYLICDEAHLLKNPEAKRTQAVLGRPARKNKGEEAVPGLTARRRAFLTGTPIPNRPIEAQTILGALCPERFGNRFGFGRRWCDGHQKPAGRKMVWDFSGASNLAELQNLMRSTCFYYDTLIECQEGQYHIGDIVEYAQPIRVLSVNMETAAISWQPITAHIKRAAPRRMVRIQHQTGELTCTSDHQIWTAEGWVRAEALATGMCLSVVQDSLCCAEQQPQILFRQMRGAASGASRAGQNKGQYHAVPESQEAPANIVPMVSKERHRQEVLRQQVLRQVELPPSPGLPRDQGYPWQDATLHRESKGGGDCPGLPSAWKARERQNTSQALPGSEARVGNEESRRFLPLPSLASSTQTSPEETEPAAPDARGRTRPDGRFHGGTDTNQRQRHLCRHCDRYAHYRGGRSDACPEDSENSGQTTRQRLAESWIHRVEILELGDRRISAEGAPNYQWVYDIEVAGNHTFFANGVLVHNCMIRRLKSQVLTELPPKRRAVVEIPANGAAPAVERERRAWLQHEDSVTEAQARVELSRASDDRADYERAVDGLAAAQRAAFTEMSIRRHETALAKVPAVIERLGLILDEEGRKAVVFAHHHDVVEAIRVAFADVAVVLTGETPMAERQQAVDRFQSDPTCRLFIGSITAAGVGLTLTAAAHVVFAELDWVPGNVTQAEDRLHRLGQHDSVLVEHLVLEGSLDARMARVLVEKQTVADRALDRLADETAAEPVTMERAATSGARRAKLDEEATQLSPDMIARVHEALRMLAARCDGAVMLDGAGFSRVDVRVGKSLAEAGALTPRQAALGARLARKYSRQLDGWTLAGVAEEAPEIGA